VEVEVEEPEAEAENAVAERVSALEQQVAQILELLQGMANSQEMAMSKIKEIAESPAEPAIKTGKTFSNVEFSSLKSEIEELKEVAKKFKFNPNGLNAVKG